jgi:hypothetical protein
MTQPTSPENSGSDLIVAAHSEKLLTVTGGALAQNMALIVTPIVDDSSSINACGNTDAIIGGHNGYIEKMRKQTGNILVGTRYLNGSWLNKHRPPAQAILMSRENYDTRHGTPLYDQGVAALNEVREISSDIRRSGIDVFDMTVFFSDGCDEKSIQYRADDVRRIVEAMIETKKSIVAAIAVEDGHTDFYAVFRSMGIPEQWIDVIRRNKQEIHRSFDTMTDLASNASMSGDDFTQTSIGGFRKPRKP